MKLIKPSFEILTPLDEKSVEEMLHSIELAGRTCYKSEDKMTYNSHLQFIEMIIKRGHESVLEHRTITVKFICDRGVSHELVRHRIASFSQESTRYCNYSKDKFDNQLTFIIPEWLDDSISNITNLRGTSDAITKLDIATREWLFSMWNSEETYNKLISIGWQPQQARSILPNSLKTEIVITANLREWRTIFKQRTSPAAHPQMRELMIPLLNVMDKKLPIIFQI